MKYLYYGLHINMRPLFPNRSRAQVSFKCGHSEKRIGTWSQLFVLWSFVLFNLSLPLTVG